MNKYILNTSESLDIRIDKIKYQIKRLEKFNNISKIETAKNKLNRLKAKQKRY